MVKQSLTACISVLVLSGCSVWPFQYQTWSPRSEIAEQIRTAPKIPTPPIGLAPPLDPDPATRWWLGLRVARCLDRQGREGFYVVALVDLGGRSSGPSTNGLRRGDQILSVGQTSIDSDNQRLDIALHRASLAKQATIGVLRYDPQRVELARTTIIIEGKDPYPGNQFRRVRIEPEKWCLTIGRPAGSR